MSRIESQSGEANMTDRQTFSLANRHIEAIFLIKDAALRLVSLARSDGSDALQIESDEFEVVCFDQSRFTFEQYILEGIQHDADSFEVNWRCHDGFSGQAPKRVIITYTLGNGPYLYKDVYLEMQKGEDVDRLQVMRFSTDQTTTRGGHAQPLFVGNWFFGINYPCFYSRHSDGFVEPDFEYTFHYSIELEEGEREYAPRGGLNTLFHFPGPAKRQPNGSWGIHGKRAVMGIAENKHEGPELGLLDYIEKNRKVAPSYLHFNNWYTAEAKNIEVENFVHDVATKVKSQLERYGARLDAMVPDDGWHRKSGFKKIYEPLYPLPEVSQALQKIDVDFGIWIAIDGTSTPADEGEKAGYEAVDLSKLNESHDKSPWGLHTFFNILDPQYLEDYKEAARYLLETCDVRYIKHDFNHMYTHRHLSERHAREACLDATLDLIAYERELNPQVIINYTNGTFFSPFWLLFVEYLWMNSGDHGVNTGVPQISRLEDTTSYRDHHFHESFNRPERTVRPILPIANLMTHGILHASHKKYYAPETDPIHEWLNYVVMYYGRGTLIKELYLSPDEMTEEMWKALGTASGWAQKNEATLRNTVLIGGDAGRGEVYGYISWQGDEAILTIRNPMRKSQTLTVPFDAMVYYRGALDQTFRARTIYPFVEHMPWQLTSGVPFSVEVPGDSVLVLELCKGSPLVDTVMTPQALPPIRAAYSNENHYALTLDIPDESFPHYELLLYHGELGETPPSPPMLDGKLLRWRRKTETGNIITAYDLRPYRGQTVSISGTTPHDGERIEQAWLVVDREVQAPTVDATQKKEGLPWSISQDHRRLTQEIILRPPLSRI